MRATGIPLTEEHSMSRPHDVIAALTAVLGPTQVISDTNQLELYRLDGLRPSRGYRDRGRLGRKPECVVRPQTPRMCELWYNGPTPLMCRSSPMGEAQA